MYISYIYLVETDLYNVERARCRRREEKNCTNEKSYFEIVKTMFELAHTHSLIHKEYKNRERERENEKWRMSEKKPELWLRVKRKIKHIASTNTKDETSHFPTDGNVYIYSGGISYILH